MEYSIILVICVIAILTLKIAFQVKIRDIKKIKEIGYDNKLNEMTNVFPENETVCKDILKQLGNDKVIIEISEKQEHTLSYYSVVTNKITIANIKDTFTRIQTIAHECIHTIQNRKMLLFNFVFSNIYLLYFVLIVILTICKVIKNPMIALGIFSILGMIYYGIRSYLETDAMTRAPYVAEQYMKKSNKISDKDLTIIMDNYEELNKVGIPMINFQLIVSVIIKIIIYCIIAIVV